jgi:hypothetical protein
MKKVIFTLIIITSLTSKVFAQNNDQCGNSYVTAEETSRDIFNIYSTYKNKSEKNITIVAVGLKSKDGKVMKEVNVNLDLKPFGITSTFYNIQDLNMDIAGSSYYRCRFGVPSAQNTTSSKANHYNDIDQVVVVLVFIILGLGVGAYFWNLEKDHKSAEFKKTYYDINDSNLKKKQTVEKKIKETVTETPIFKDVLDGKKPLVITYWIYFIGGELLISFLSGALSVLIGKWIVLSAVIYTFLLAPAVWKSADYYIKEKQRLKIGYAWATTAKVFAILHCLGSILSSLNFITSNQ